MYIFTLVTDVRKVIEKLRASYGDFNLAMLYNSALGMSSNWNLIVSSDWTERLGVAEATKIIARELHQTLGLENKLAISRVTVLKTGDPFVRDITRMYPVLAHEGVPLNQVTADGVTDGAGFLFYSQRKVAA
ncbi:MAG TPA: hypothetical protein VKF79_06580 [Candidatus Acidoferrum sp.]|nr:hypothetical protein [Candidatus Acidoferrum sp.]